MRTTGEFLSGKATDLMIEACAGACVLDVSTQWLSFARTL
jgi:hypothetical protein